MKRHLSSKKSIHFYFLVIIAACFFLYGNSLRNEFVWDDEYLILTNPALRSLASIPSVFLHNLGYASSHRGLYYRPIQELSYFFDYQLWHLNPFGYHLTNIVLHASNACLVFLIGQAILRHKLASFLSAILFLSQPMHLQAVTYISGRADLWAALFSLASFYFYVRLEGKDQSFLVAGLYTLALFSKEIVLVMPFAILAYHYFFQVKVTYKRIGLFLVPIALFLFARAIALNPALILKTNLNAVDPPFYGRFLLSFKALVFYGINLIWPFDIYMERTISPPRNLLDPLVLIGLLAWVFAITLFLLKKRKNPEALFYLSWFLIFFLPVSNLIPFKFNFANHWMYIASVGFYGALAHVLVRAIERLVRSAKTRIVLAALLLSPFVIHFATLTVERNKVWRNAYTLYSDLLKYRPQSYSGLFNLGNAYLKNGKLDKALEYYDRVLKMEGDKEGTESKIYTNRSYIYLQREDYNAAERDLKKAISMNPTTIKPYVNLGIVYRTDERYEEAVDILQEGLDLYPDDFEAYYQLGSLYLFLGEEDRAATYFQKARKISPHDERLERMMNRERMGSVLA